MPIADKIAAAKKISELLNGIISTGDFRLRYKIMVDPPGADHDFSKPEIKVELSGADSPLVKERGGELLRAFEHVALEMLRLGNDGRMDGERGRMGYFGRWMGCLSRWPGRFCRRPCGFAGRAWRFCRDSRMIGNCRAAA